MQRVGRFSLVLFSCGLLILLFSGQKALESQADSSDFLLSQGKKQWGIGLFDSAYTLFRLAQRSSIQANNLPQHAEATYRAGLYLARQMRLDEAILTLDSAIALGSPLDSLSHIVLFARRERAYVALNQGEIPDAIHRYHDLLHDMEPLPPAADSIRGLVHESLGQAYFYQGNFEAGLQKSKEALALYQHVFPPNHVKIGICANTLGIMYMYLDRFPEAIEHFELCSKIFETHYPPAHSNILQVQTNIGVLYGEMGLFWKSLEAHQKVFQQKEKLEPQPYVNALLNLGATLVSVGDYQNALDHFDQAEAFLQGYPEMMAEQSAYIAQNRSAIYQQMGNEEAALQQIEKALEQDKKTKGADHPELITEYFQWGDLLMSQKQFQAAKAAFEQALKITKKNIGKYSLQGGHALNYLGRLARLEKDFGLALEQFKASQKHYIAIENAFQQANTYSELAVTWRLSGQKDSCMAMHQKAWDTLLPGENMRDAPPQILQKYWTFHPLEEMLFEQGESIRTFAKNPATSFDGTSPDTLLYREALAYFETALAVVDSQRHYYESPTSKQVRLTDQLPVYEAALDMCFELYLETGNDYYLDHAFQLAEKSKANNLRDHLRGVEALRFAGLPDSLLARERYFRQRMAVVNEAILDTEMDSSFFVGLKKEEFELYRAYRAFIQHLEQHFPAYYSLKIAHRTPQTEQILTTMDKNQALYSYFWGAQNMYVFRLFQGKIQLFQQNLDSISPHLKDWKTFISVPPKENSPTQLFSGAFALTQNLLPGLSSQIRQISILPDGMLGYLPFESLPGGNVSNSDFRAWPFLGKTIAFNYAPAAEIWMDQQKGKPSNSRYLGFAPQFEAGDSIKSRNQLSPLVHNQDEVKTVAKLLQGKSYLGAEAAEKRVKNLGKEAFILHFATHALADENDLMRSRLFLKNTDDTTEDGILYAYEIYGMQLNSPLCVLSACQTAKGPLQRGEGVMSLARAFQYSGCKRVLSTLWQTDDRAATSLSQDFFAALAEGLPAEAALLRARKNWLEEADNVYAHPYFWANYVLIGDGGVIPIKKSRPWVWIGGFLFLALTLSLIWRKRREQRTESREEGT